jgi:hypothetical protein
MSCSFPTSIEEGKKCIEAELEKQKKAVEKKAKDMVKEYVPGMFVDALKLDELNKRMASFTKAMSDFAKNPKIDENLKHIAKLEAINLSTSIANTWYKIAKIVGVKSAPSGQTAAQKELGNLTLSEKKSVVKGWINTLGNYNDTSAAWRIKNSSTIFNQIVSNARLKELATSKDATTLANLFTDLIKDMEAYKATVLNTSLLQQRANVQANARKLWCQTHPDDKSCPGYVAPGPGANQTERLQETSSGIGTGTILAVSGIGLFALYMIFKPKRG